MIDSLTGYLNAMPEQPFIVLQMHELLTYLNQQGVVTILILAQHGMVGQMVSPIDLTYLSDAVVLLRFFEANGRIRRALSVVKRRTGAHEDTIREFRIDSAGFARWSAAGAVPGRVDRRADIRGPARLASGGA